MISYGQKKSRREAIAATRSRIGALTQLKMCLWIMSGPQAILSVVLNTFIMDFLVPINESNEEPPALTRAALQIIALLIIGDFCLYWGHRIQHMNNILWNNCHWFHHQIDSPTPVSTVYIEKTDASLQGGFPIIVAAAVVQPHPFVMYAYIMLRVADNAINHSGVESTVLNILFLKCLPLRGSVSHHDSHHRYLCFNVAFLDYLHIFFVCTDSQIIRQMLKTLVNISIFGMLFLGTVYDLLIYRNFCTSYLHGYITVGHTLICPPSWQTLKRVVKWNNEN